MTPLRLALIASACGALLLGPTVGLAQQPAPGASTQVQSGQTQTVRGRVLDVTTQQPLPGAQVRVTGTALGAISDDNGSFAIANVPVGRQQLVISYIGYQQAVVSNVLVTTGQEAKLLVELQESVVTTDEVVISANTDPKAPNNEFITLSSRTFNAEETGRFAGSRNDVSRMAANFAGVSGANDARNDIVIRGNSPLGLLWRMEGIDIPNPNHYAGTGNTGGPVSMLNNNLLERSDFLTSAFPANYGNAISGVFDLRMRSGNSENHEFLGQIGFNGFEVGAEGPINREKQSSYIVNYRLSNLEAFSAVGLSVGTGNAIPRYQDVAFKLNFPLTSIGAISVWGFAGASRIELLDSDTEDKSGDDLYGNGGFDNYVSGGTGVIGVTQRLFFGSKTTGTFNASYSSNINRFRSDSLDLNRRVVAPQGGNNLQQDRLGLNYLVSHKFNAANNLQVGVRADVYYLTFSDSNRQQGVMQLQRNVKDEDNLLLQAFAQWQHRFNDKVTLNLGLNAQQFSRNDNEVVVEPRAGARWQFAPTQAITGGVGLHHQIQPLWAYYYVNRSFEPNPGQQSNLDMGFTRSLHYALGYEWGINGNTRLKVETYYQQIDNAPVQQGSTFSLLNAGTNFGPEDEGFLVNEGEGRNYGVEVTLERNFDKGLYYLFTTSLYRSFYTDSRGVERPSAWDGGYVTNLLAGKEWRVTSRGGMLTLDGKLTMTGGRRFTPLNLAASQAAGSAIFDESQPFSQRLDAYQRLDIKIGYRLNRPRVTHEFSIDLQNVLGRENPLTQTYDRFTNSLRVENQIGFLPIPQYRITF